MNNSNYYVAVDESGQPYIAHMQPSDRGGRGRHKYMAKFENFFNNGKAFYAYTQEQVRQAMNRGQNKAKSQLNFRGKQIATRSGIAERELNKAAQNVKIDAANTANSIKTRANEIIKNATKGRDIKQQRENLQASYNAAIANGEDQLADMLRPQLDKLNKEYVNTWLAKGEYAVNNVRKN